MTFEIIFSIFCVGGFSIILFNVFILSDYRIHNTVYECGNCKRLSRRYQCFYTKSSIYDLYFDPKCPGCNSKQSMKVIDDKKWMKKHPVFKKHNMNEFFKFQKNIKLNELREEDLEDKKRRDRMLDEI